MVPEAEVRKLKKIERDALLIIVGLALLFVFLTKGLSATLAVLLGGALMLLNFHFLWRFSKRVFEKESKQKFPFIAGLFALFFVFLGAIGVSILVLKIPVAPFVIGTMALLVSIFLNGVLLGLNRR
jgi:hypothetical protein